MIQEEFSIKKFFKDIFNKGNFKDYFKRNKIFLSVSLIILLLSLWSGFTNYSSYTQILSDSLLSHITTVPTIAFSNTLLTDALIMVAGFTFSLLSILLTVVNGVSIAYLFATQNFAQMVDVYLPYGIFEIISYVFALTGAFLVTKMEVRLISMIIKRNFKDTFSKIKVPLKDLILTIFLILILLLIGLALEILL